MKISLQRILHFGDVLTNVGNHTATIDIFVHDSDLSVAESQTLLRWFKSRGCPIEEVIVPELDEKGYRLNDH